MRTRQLTDLIADVRKEADIEAATLRFPDAELTEYINQGVARLCDKIRNAQGPQFFEALKTYTTTANTSVYALPNDFYECISVSAKVNSADYIPLERIDRMRRDYLRSASPSWSAQPIYYLIEGKTTYADAGSIEFLPIPGAGLTIEMRYEWAPTRLSAGSDVFDGIGGWERYLILYAARCAAGKDQDFDTVGRCTAEMGEILGDIQAGARRRDAGQPARVRDVRGQFAPFGRARRWGRY